MQKIILHLITISLLCFCGCVTVQKSNLNKTDNKLYPLLIAVSEDNFKQTPFNFESNGKYYRFTFGDYNVQRFVQAFKDNMPKFFDIVFINKSNVEKKYDLLLKFFPIRLHDFSKNNLKFVSIKFEMDVEFIKKDGSILMRDTFVGIGTGSPENRFSWTHGYDKDSRNKKKALNYIEAANLAYKDIFLKMSRMLSNHPNPIDNYLPYLVKIKKEETERKTLPSELVFKLQYTDKTSFLPNNSIDAGEASLILVELTNVGKGTAFDVNIITESSHKNIDFPETVPVSDIQPGESKNITIPIKADLFLVSGTALFMINAREKRGYNSRPLELQIPTAKLHRPQLLFASCNLNDYSGLADGDGDGVAENNEIIEVNPYFKNEGVGDALKVKVQLSSISEGLEIIKSQDELLKLSPGSTKKSTLAFKIPRTYAESKIKYTIIATDVRGIKTGKSYTIPFDAKSPKLKFSYEIIDQNNEVNPYLENGKSYRLMIVPENIGNNFAQGVRTSVQTTSKKALIGTFNNDVGIIDSDIKGRTITIPIDLRRSFSESSLVLKVRMEQDSFPGIEKDIILPVHLKQPNLQYKVTSLNGVDDNNISRNTSSNFRISINNKGYMDAEDVKVRFRSMKNGIEFDEEKNIGKIRSGGNQYVDFTFFVRGDVEIGSFPVKLAILQTDFETITSDLSYKIVEQTALVQKVKGTGQSMSGGDIKNAYTGPPQFYINAPYNNIKTINQQISLHGSIITFGAGNATQDLTITLNGRPLSILSVQEDVKLDPNIVTKREIEDNKMIFDGSIILDPGKNVIRISSIDRNGIKGSETVTVIKQATLGNIYAVVIGVSEFFNKDYNLEYAGEDARKFYNFLKSKIGGNLPDDRIKFLYNHMATRVNVIDSLINFLGQTSKEDIVEIYMATHGYVGMDGKLYYICHDTDVDNLKGTGFSDDDLTEILSQDIKAGKVIIYLDTCHAGLSGLSKLYAKRDIGIIGLNRQTNKLAAEISRTKNGVAKFSATSANGVSLEDPILNGGVFTHWLIKGLNGEANENNDEWVNAVELEKYLRKNVTMATKGKQTPKAIITLDDNTPLAKVR